MGSVLFLGERPSPVTLEVGAPILAAITIATVRLRFLAGGRIKDDSTCCCQTCSLKRSFTESFKSALSRLVTGRSGRRVDVTI